MSTVSLSKWNLLHSWLLLAGFIVAIGVKSAIPLVLPALLSFGYLIFLQRSELKKMIPFGGYANYITAVRLALIMVISIFNLEPLNIFIIAAISFLLDGVDGYVARKLKQESNTGVFFDLEVDAFYVLILSLLIWHNVFLSGWILIPAVMRYIFVIIINFLRSHQTNRRTRYGPLIAGLHFAALLLPFILPMRFFFPVCALTSTMVIGSFIYSFYLSLKNRYSS